MSLRRFLACFALASFVFSLVVKVLLVDRSPAVTAAINNPMSVVILAVCSVVLATWIYRLGDSLKVSRLQYAGRLTLSILAISIAGAFLVSVGIPGPDFLIVP
jgi:uncharacterized membrane protein